MNHFERRQIRSATQEELKMMLDKNQGHERKAHDGLAMSQTGLVKKCARCFILRNIKETP